MRKNLPLCLATMLLAVMLTASCERNQEIYVHQYVGLPTLKTSLACSADLLEFVTPQQIYIITGEQSETITPSINHWVDSGNFSFTTNNVTLKFWNHDKILTSVKDGDSLELNVKFTVDESKAIDPEKIYRFAYGFGYELLQPNTFDEPAPTYIIIDVRDVTTDVKGTDNVKAYLKRLAEDSNLMVKVSNESGKLHIVPHE